MVKGTLGLKLRKTLKFHNLFRNQHPLDSERVSARRDAWAAGMDNLSPPVTVESASSRRTFDCNGRRQRTNGGEDDSTIDRFSYYTKLNGAVYCYRSCLWACLQRADGVCYHDNSKLPASIFTKLGM